MSEGQSDLPVSKGAETPCGSFLLGGQGQPCRFRWRILYLARIRPGSRRDQETYFPDFRKDTHASRQGCLQDEELEGAS